MIIEIDKKLHKKGKYLWKERLWERIKKGKALSSLDNYARMRAGTQKITT